MSLNIVNPRIATFSFVLLALANPVSATTPCVANTPAPLPRIATVHSSEIYTQRHLDSIKRGVHITGWSIEAFYHYGGIDLDQERIIRIDSLMFGFAHGGMEPTAERLRAAADRIHIRFGSGDMYWIDYIRSRPLLPAEVDQIECLIEKAWAAPVRPRKHVDANHIPPHDDHRVLAIVDGESAREFRFTVFDSVNEPTKDLRQMFFALMRSVRPPYLRTNSATPDKTH